MTSSSTTSRNPDTDIRCAVLEDDDIAVVRVFGRGSFLNSVPFKRFADHLQTQGHPRQFLVDLAQCETMDSTFMGVLASVSIAQTKSGREKLLVANANDHVRRLLKTLGLTHLLSIHDGDHADRAISKAEEHLQAPSSGPVSRLDQILHTLEAHKTLVRIDDENELRFQSVIHYLEKSLQNAEDGKEDF